MQSGPDASKALPGDGAADTPWGTPPSGRYPMRDLPFVAAAMPDDERLADALEEFLINYGHNTARAYLADLLDIYDWCEAKGLDFFGLEESALKPYLALLRRRKYSENTVRRRLTAWRQFQKSLNIAGNVPTSE